MNVPVEIPGTALRAAAHEISGVEVGLRKQSVGLEVLRLCALGFFRKQPMEENS